MNKEYEVDVYREGWNDWDYFLSFKNSRRAMSTAKNLIKNKEAGRVRVVEILDPEGLNEPKTIFEI